MLRLVFGLGTRAVDRSDDDYTRVVALNAPERRPGERLRRSPPVLAAQGRRDRPGGQPARLAASFADVARQSPDLPVDMFASRRPGRWPQLAEERGLRNVFPWVLTFDRLLTRDAVRRRHAADARHAPGGLRLSGGHGVHGQFLRATTATRSTSCSAGRCRSPPAAWPSSCPRTSTPTIVILEAHGAVIGQSRVSLIDRLIYVVPSVYGQLPISDRYASPG